MRFSILTPTLNQCRFLEETIQSVAIQNGPDVEHIIIDGGSTDGTLDVLRTYPHVKWTSGKDRGQADALNKGLERATGELIGWVNSDDYYATGIFDRVSAAFSDRSVDWVVGDVVMCYPDGSRLSRPSPTITYGELIRDADIVRQQGTFFRRSALERVGGWNPDLFMAMDYDLWLRLSKCGNPLMVHEVWAYFRMHEDQKSTSKNLRRQAAEIDSLLAREGASSVTRFRLQGRKRLQLCKAQIKAGLISAGIVHPRYAGRPLRLGSD